MADERLHLIQAEVKRIERSVRILKRMVAQELEEPTATAKHTVQEDTDNGISNRSKDQQD